MRYEQGDKRSQRMCPRQGTQSTCASNGTRSKTLNYIPYTPHTSYLTYAKCSGLDERGFAHRAPPNGPHQSPSPERCKSPILRQPLMEEPTHAETTSECWRLACSGVSRIRGRRRADVRSPIEHSGPAVAPPIVKHRCAVAIVRGRWNSSGRTNVSETFCRTAIKSHDRWSSTAPAETVAPKAKIVSPPKAADGLQRNLRAV